MPLCSAVNAEFFGKSNILHLLLWQFSADSRFYWVGLEKVLLSQIHVFEHYQYINFPSVWVYTLFEACKNICDYFSITDIDECAQKGGFNGNHCHLNTVCMNTNGSYECDCLPGYRRVDKFNCVELNECTTGQHACHENAECINTMGSYHCRCKDGYEGNGFDCKREYRL